LGHPDYFFFFNQNDVVLIKKQKSTGRNRVFNRVTPGFFFSCFFFNPARFQLWIDPLGRTGFQNYD
jgi:hypothetical protein